MAYTTSRIALEGGAVIGVVHYAEGDWWFLDGEPVAGDEPVALHLDHVVGAHPRVAEVGNLPLGWEAWLDTAHGEWIRQPIPEE